MEIRLSDYQYLVFIVLCFWNAGFLLVISIVLQLITGILLALHYTPDI